MDENASKLKEVKELLKIYKDKTKSLNYKPSARSLQEEYLDKIVDLLGVK